jgi:hypothetical protein
MTNQWDGGGEVESYITGPNEFKLDLGTKLLQGKKWFCYFVIHLLSASYEPGYIFWILMCK